MANVWITVRSVVFFRHKQHSTGTETSQSKFLMCHPLKYLAVAALTLLIVSPVHAIPVLGSFQGTVRTSDDSVGNLFNTDLSGQTVEGTFSYDTDLRAGPKNLNSGISG